MTAAELLVSVACSGSSLLKKSVFRLEGQGQVAAVLVRETAVCHMLQMVWQPVIHSLGAMLKNHHEQERLPGLRNPAN